MTNNSTRSTMSGLYQVGAWAAAEFMLLINSGVLHTTAALHPASVADWFTLLHSHPFIGLTLLDAFDLVNFALVGLIFLGLYAALEHTHNSGMILALVLCWTAIAVYFSCNQSLSVLSLSVQYSSATTEAQ